MNATIVGLVVGLLLVVLTVALILVGGSKDKNLMEASSQGNAAVVTPPQKMGMDTGRVDDLTIIEGIGPKISGLLRQHGITTFAQLAVTDIAVLENILKTNDLQFVKPDSWPKQARLAAEGKMAELKALQETLIAGR